METPQLLDQMATESGRYRVLVDAITDYAIYMLDPTGIVSSWNSGAQRFKGYKPEEIIGSHFSIFYTEEDQARGMPQRALDTAANEGRFEAEGWRVRKDGTRYWAHVIIDPIRDKDGRVISYAKVTRDLTEKRIAEAALRKSEEQFARLVQGVTDYAIYMLDPEGIVSNWNLGAQRIKGYSRDEIVGKSFETFYTPEDRAKGEAQRGLAAARREGRFEKEGWRVRKDGTRFWANVVIDAIRDETGEIIGFAKITRDITERLKAQQALEQAREQLVQAQKMEAIGQLTGGIAHDFNNLLMAVLGSLELLRKRLPNDPGLLRLLENAYQGAQRGASLTQRMLAFARRQSLNLTSVDLQELVVGMADLLRGSIGPSIAIETDFPDALPHAETDANQLEVALLNLAVNARDAMPDGGTITFSGRVEAVTADQASLLKPGTYVCLGVSDTGAGMDEATLSRAAEPFFTTKGVGKGTGLGLSMVHGLAEQSGGRLVLTSKLGEGTRAELWIPAATEKTQTQPVEPEPVEPVSTAVPRLILAVDDDALVLMNTTAMLEDLGHRVIEAMSGEEALRRLAAEPNIDLVITDQAMPQMSGTQLAEAIAERWPDLPVVLATGYAELPPGIGASLPRMGKPFQQKDLAEMVARVAYRSKAISA